MKQVKGRHTDGRLRHGEHRLLRRHSETAVNRQSDTLQEKERRSRRRRGGEEETHQEKDELPGAIFSGGHLRNCSTRKYTESRSSASAVANISHRAAGACVTQSQSIKNKWTERKEAQQEVQGEFLPIKAEECGAAASRYQPAPYKKTLQ